VTATQSPPSRTPHPRRPPPACRWQPRHQRPWARLLVLALSLALVVAVVPRVLADAGGQSFDDGMSFFEPSDGAPGLDTKTERFAAERSPAGAERATGGSDGDVIADGAVVVRSGEEHAEAPAAAEVRPEGPLAEVAPGEAADTGDQDGSGRAGRDEQGGGSGGCAGHGCSPEPPPGDATAGAAVGDGARRLLARTLERLGWKEPQEPASEASRPLTQQLADLAESHLRVVEARQALLATERRMRSVSEHVDDHVRVEEAMRLLGPLVEATFGTPEHDRMRALASRSFQALNHLNDERRPPAQATPLRMAEWRIREAEIAVELRQVKGQTPGEQELHIDEQHLEQAYGDLERQRQRGWWVRRSGQIAELTRRAEQAQQRLTGGNRMSVVEAPRSSPATEARAPQVPAIAPTVGNGPDIPGIPPAVAVADRLLDTLDPYGDQLREVAKPIPPSLKTPTQAVNPGLWERIDARFEDAPKPDATTTAVGGAAVGTLGVTALWRALSATHVGRVIVGLPYLLNELQKALPMAPGPTQG
jgi:hypothetical protein